MTRAQADALVYEWDMEMHKKCKADLEAGKEWKDTVLFYSPRRIMTHRVLDCLAGWRPYDPEVAEALDTMEKSDKIAPQVREIREICEGVGK